MSDEPEFLTVDDILEIHRDQIERYGGDEGIRDNGPLMSAVGMPQQSFGCSRLRAPLSLRSRRSRDVV